MDSTQGEQAQSLEEACRHFGSLLGLEEPVSERVMRAALNDDMYAHNLLTCKKAPAFLRHLLANPPEVDSADSAVLEHSTAVLLSRAVKALWKWGRSGFGTVDDATFRKRYDACQACPNLVEAPSGLVYRLVSSGNTDEDKVCSLCGCVAARKAKLPSESCPARHPELSGLSRWEEPFSQ